MSFGLNRAEVIGRLGADVTVNHLASGGRVANLSIATDESYIDRNAGGERIDKTEWHRVVTFQDGLIDMLEKHAKKGRLVYVAGKMQTRKWRKDGEDSDRYSTEILLVPGGRVQFLERPAAPTATAPRRRTTRRRSPPRAATPIPTTTLATFLSDGSPPARRPGADPAHPLGFGIGPFSVNERDAAGRFDDRRRVPCLGRYRSCPAAASASMTSGSAGPATTNARSSSTGRPSAPSCDGQTSRTPMAASSTPSTCWTIFVGLGWSTTVTRSDRSPPR